MAAETQVVEVEGRPTRCLVAGDGPPLLLLHGLGTSADEWGWVMPLLAARFRVYAPDLQQVPARGAPAGMPAPAFEAAFVCALLDALGLPAAALVGSSLGGLVALQVALAAPGRVTALVLADSAGLGRGVHPGLRALALPGLGEATIMWGSTPAGAGQRALGRGALLFASPARIPPAWLTNQYWLAQQPGFLAATLAALRAQVAPEGQRCVLLPQLAQLGAATLVLWGEQDQVVPAGQARQTQPLLRRGQLALIDGCGHLPHVEQPGRFAAAVEQWFGELSPVRRRT